WEAPGVDAAEFVEAIEAEPLAKKFRPEPARLWVGGHALHLFRELGGPAELAGGGGAAQLVVGDRRPEEEAEATRHFPVVERALGAGCDGLDAVEKCRRH